MANETNKKKQALLAYLGYYFKDIDGDWGAGSQQAAKNFCKDYGIASDANLGSTAYQKLKEAVYKDESPVISNTVAGDFWSGIKYFKKSEFKCQCGGKYCTGFPVDIDETVVKYADEIRKRIGKPLSVNSGVRDVTHNRAVGGVDGSYHTKGKAIDLGCPSGYTPKQMYDIAEQVIGDKGGVGLYSWGIHIDSRGYKSRF